MSKKNNNKGFTLAELLIVVAIIAVLVAIAIPVFTSQLEKSREGTDAANIRSEYAVVMTEILTEGDKEHTDGTWHRYNLKQRTPGWQGSDTMSGLLALNHSASDSGDTSVEISGINDVQSGGNVTFSYTSANNSKCPKVTIAINKS